MIRTDRLLLRAGRWDDLDAMHEIFSNAAAMRWWDRPPHEDIGVTRKCLSSFIEDPLETREEFILEFDGVCIGKAGCWRKAELGYILHPRVWGQGLATEALAAILPRAFARWPDAVRIEAEIDPNNLASRRVLEKLGFYLSGTAEKTLHMGGRWYDSAYYAMPRP